MFNEKLSQARAASVQSYLTQQGVPTASVSIHGFGEANPIASNDTPGGRQQNRRVEMVVSGESIGTPGDVGSISRKATVIDPTCSSSKGP
jgi:OmpA family